MKKEDLKALPTRTPVIVRMFGALKEHYIPATYEYENIDHTYTVRFDAHSWPDYDLGEDGDVGKYYPTMTVYADQIYRNIPHRFCRIPMKDSEVQMRTFRFETGKDGVTKIQMKNPDTGEFKHIPRVQSFSIHCKGARELPYVTLDLADLP